MERGGSYENGGGGGSNCFQRYQQQQQQQADRVSPDRGQLKPLILSSLPPRPGTPPLPPSCSPSAVLDSSGGFIEHRVSKMDTVAGIAIKYGVEVSDIKRINGLVTDLQMFALKSLRIPPGRHPPSPNLSSDFENQGSSRRMQTPPRRRHSDLFESFESLKLKSSSNLRVSSAMSSLQGYYGLKPPSEKTAPEGFEMGTFSNNKGGSSSSSHYLEDGPRMNPPLSRDRKCKSVSNNFFSQNGESVDDMAVIEARDGDSDKFKDKKIRRRQKSEADFSSYTPEKLLKEDNSSGGGFSAIKGGKGLALRTKAASRTSSGANDGGDAGFMSPIPIGWADSIIADGLNGVRKSSSASSLQEQQENGNGTSSSSASSSIWPLSKWNLKPDLPGLSPAAITNSIFDGLPKPITGRRNKAAFD